MAKKKNKKKKKKGPVVYPCIGPFGDAIAKVVAYNANKDNDPVLLVRLLSSGVQAYLVPRAALNR